MSFSDQADRTLALLAVTPGWQRLRSLRQDCDDETVAAIVGEAASFAERVLAPLDAVGDRIGCRIENGRVVTPPGFAAGYRQFAAAGWIGIDVGECHGGSGLPLAVQAACAPLFERGCMSLMMAAGSARAACHLLAAVADAETADRWIPKLLAGDWAATICISEPDAGSDVGRIRTAAAWHDGIWRVTGQKVWISFGDHDLCGRIGHCLLARTGEEAGTRGLSLFLVPDRHADGRPNGVTPERIEEKMGLHGSPTCALRFEAAEAILLGEAGRGLPQLFAMIEQMRLQTGGQGLGLASACCDIAEAYARERRQGGAPDAPAVPIAAHPDVRRQLRSMRHRTEILRAAHLEIACAMDLARIAQDPPDRAAARDFAGTLLPLIKTFGAEAGFDIASAGIQVLGGAGYTKDWPLERHLRDARVMSIYEGTTGMQAIDLLARRLWRDGGMGLEICLERAAADIALGGGALARSGMEAVEEFRALLAHMQALKATPEAGLERADSFLRAFWCLVSIWMLRRLGSVGLGEDELRQSVDRLRAELALFGRLCR
ncbi:acyl-CoA dehydrogenase family protein [Rhizobium halophytocola]|uniref:Alkylation response protein AidB-like acyl-CoA dehydrogenase n=1 Tax=Rhizobium halophytocola TaxID=735519 RepID=A0ABS4E1F7_9HYPH|nr:acyl-CoA dehydrogenase family protein [Rhizobium halophytocola]MBP1851775.1 alkylation response protein AidB-like acyl-CoA dehydrogenase [Rhizobium halophytocola]